MKKASLLAKFAPLATTALRRQSLDARLKTKRPVTTAQEAVPNPEESCVLPAPTTTKTRLARRLIAGLARQVSSALYLLFSPQEQLSFYPPARSRPVQRACTAPVETRLELLAQ